MTQEQLLRNLTNLKPSDVVIMDIEVLRESAKVFGNCIFTFVPAGPERTIACRKLEEALMFAIKAMVLTGEAT